MARTKHAAAPEDPNGAPNSARSAFSYFLNSKRKGIKDTNPDISFGDLSRKLCAEFQALSPQEKKPWEDKAVMDKERYNTEMEDYQKKKKQNMLQQLPIEMATQVLDFSDIPARIKLAQCSLTLQTRVYRECSQVWKHIGFHEVKEELRKRLTDLELSKLLTRVSAREVTEELHLDFCIQIQGTGLTPLQHSRVLAQLWIKTRHQWFGYYAV